MRFYEANTVVFEKPDFTSIDRGVSSLLFLIQQERRREGFISSEKGRKVAIKRQTVRQLLDGDVYGEYMLAPAK